MTDESAAPAPPKETVDDTPPPQLGPLTIKLYRKPISAHGEDNIRELKFREPSIKDIIEVGVPATWAWELGTGQPIPRVNIDAARMTEMMVRLGNVPPSSIRMMDARDWANCANALAGFFLPDLTEPTAPAA